MNLRTTLAVAGRVLTQVRRDHRTLAMLLITSVTTLRERSSGTLERLLTMPLGKLDLLLGYAVAFGLLAAVQSALAVAVSVGLLQILLCGLFVPRDALPAVLETVSDVLPLSYAVEAMQELVATVDTAVV